jgi:hypothetical protein
VRSSVSEVVANAPQFVRFFILDAFTDSKEVINKFQSVLGCRWPYRASSTRKPGLCRSQAARVAIASGNVLQRINDSSDVFPQCS